MFESVVYDVVGGFLDGTIKVVGAISLVAGFLLIYFYDYRIRPSIPLNRTTYKILKIIGRYEIVLVMVGAALYLIVSWADLRAGFSVAWYWRLVFSIAIGVGVVLVIGRKGLGIPLGYGVMVTIDRAHRLKLDLTGQVLSFHVNGRFLKYREEALARIAETILVINGRYGSHDAIFLSWIFANKAAIRLEYKDFYKKVRLNLLMANVLFWTVLGGILLAVLDLVYRAYTKNFDGLHLLRGLALCASCISFSVAILCLASVRKRVKALLVTNDAIAISERVDGVVDGLKLPEERFSRVNIAHGPMPLVHLVSLSPIRKVMRSALGIESGFVIVGRKEECH